MSADTLPTLTECANMVVTRWIDDPHPPDLHTHVGDVLTHEGSHLNPSALWAEVAEVLAEELVETAVALRVAERDA